MHTIRAHIQKDFLCYYLDNDNNSLRCFLLVTPMISSLSLMDNANSESEVLSIGISVIMLNIGMYLGIPAVVIVGIRKAIF